MFVHNCLYLQGQGWSLSGVWDQPSLAWSTKARLLLLDTFPIYKPWKSSFLPEFFLSENILLGAAPCPAQISAWKASPREDDSRASSLWSDVNKYLLFGIKTSFTPQSAILQHCLYTTFILHFCWELLISNKSCRDAGETFVFNRVLAFILKEGRVECVCHGWQNAEMQLLSALSWCQEGTAPAAFLPRYWRTDRHFFIKSPFFHNSFLLCVHLIPMFTKNFQLNYLEKAH